MKVKHKGTFVFYLKCYVVMYHIFIGFNSNYNQDVKLVFLFFVFFYELNTMCITIHTISKGPGWLNELGSWII
jgi:hypothetical protein